MISYIIQHEHEASLSIDSSAAKMAPRFNHNKQRATKHKTERTKRQSGNISSFIIRQYNTDGVYISEYDSVPQAVEMTGISEKSIRNALYGIRKSGGGSLWIKCEKDSPIETIPPVTVNENNGIGKPIKQMDLEGNTIAVFPSKRSASEKTGINPRSISDVISGVQRTAGGYRWAYCLESDFTESKN